MSAIVALKSSLSMSILLGNKQHSVIQQLVFFGVTSQRTVLMLSLVLSRLTSDVVCFGVGAGANVLIHLAVSTRFVLNLIAVHGSGCLRLHVITFLISS